MRKQMLVCLALCSILMLAGVIRAQTKHAPTMDEILQLKVAGAPRISPDGRYIAYSVRETDWKENAYIRQIWLLDVVSGASVQLTRGKKSSEGAEWSPDGRWLAFVAEREANAISKDAGSTPPPSAKEEKKEGGSGDGKPAARQIWLISAQGGEAWQLTQHTTDVGAFHWSKDSRQIAFTAASEQSKANKERKQKFSDYEVFEQDFAQEQLWAVDVAAAEINFSPVKARAITHDATLDVRDFSWSPESTRIAFSATHNPLLSFAGDSDIYLVDLADGNTVHKIVALEGPDSDPVFSPNGKQIAFSTALGQQYFYYANSHIAVVNVDSVLAKTAATAAEVQDLTAQFDEDPRMMEWGPDGIYFEALQKTASHLFRLEPQTKKITRITAPDAFYLGGVSFSKDFKAIALTAEDGKHLSEVFVSSTANFAPRKLTDMTAQVKDWMLAVPEVVSWKSKDGAAIDGVLYKPADYDAAKKYPLLVVIHGGPTGISQPVLGAERSYYPIHNFAAKGALVLEPNYRGSAGYGSEFRALNVRNLGVGDMWDVMSGVDSLISLGLVDASNLGSMGWSEGGYISAFLTTHTDRFKAISVGAGISDWMTYYVNTDITPFTRQYLHATPWSDPEIYAKTSPITTIMQAKTPTLIQQGSLDKRVPVPDSFELYRGLQDQHVPARLILYTGFGHGITKPKSNKAVTQANLDWFNHYIWGDAIPKDSPLLGTSELEADK